ATDWSQILALYDQLLTVAPSTVAALNRAVAVAETGGPGAALAAVDGLDPSGLRQYYLFHAIRADFLRRLGRWDEASAAYEAAAIRTAVCQPRGDCCQLYAMSIFPKRRSSGIVSVQTPLTRLNDMWSETVMFAS